MMAVIQFEACRHIPNESVTVDPFTSTKFNTDRKKEGNWKIIIRYTFVRVMHI